LSDGPVDEGDVDTCRKRSELRAEDLDQSGGLHKESLEVDQEWASGVGAIVDVSPFGLSKEHSGTRESLKLTMQSGLAHA
jgi:hypothetical protein